ncbi:macro domain-containing protein [Sorangium sp. So ce1014]|uniref:type II toxin-antitoxin system antitoxin DNA ADP-ribosyl glycohydrolase DarG n=1 Tax=Sorangium sp. So ce1014 TaxID=3133326 RepID=UPI003F5EB8D2
MIELTRGDILRAEAEALVNTVNCVGFMGRGIALQFKHAFPRNFAEYVAACKRGEVQPGRMLVVETGQLTSPRYIVNFPTKRHWKGKSRLADIDAGLEALIADVKRLHIKSIAVPPLGCGLGGLDWADVRPRIERAFAALSNVRVLVYEPSGPPAAGQMTRSTDPPEMTPGRAVLVGLMERYLGGLLDPFVSLLEVHKLMYFMQEAGEPLRLRYEKGPFGPYAENLRHVLARIEGHLLSGYADGGDAPEKQLELVPGAASDAAAFLSGHPDTRARFDRVADLVEGFETPFGMELLATVHWVATREEVAGPVAAVDAVHQWNERKRAFSARQIHLAWDILASKGWVLSGTRTASG